VYLDLDAAWDSAPLGLPRLDARLWGPRLRCFAPRRAMEQFAAEVARELPRFVLYGSGDFHHLSAVLIANVTSDVNVIVFDNHPDWDRRPPHWACGGWVNRALELPRVKGVSVWGCGNFELNWPARIFGNRAVEVFGWRERYPKRGRITRHNWRSHFESFAQSLGDVYVSVDIDSLADAVTNWENGLFTPDDIAWAIGCLRSVVGGDICGAYSPPVYERRLQRFAAEWDHPKLPPRDLARAQAINTAAVETIWTALLRAG
jgi:arginase family enzyme